MLVIRRRIDSRDRPDDPHWHVITERV